jgi:hypothetical protein
MDGMRLPFLKNRAVSGGTALGVDAVRAVLAQEDG